MKRYKENFKEVKEKIINKVNKNTLDLIFKQAIDGETLWELGTLLKQNKPIPKKLLDVAIEDVGNKIEYYEYADEDINPEESLAELSKFEKIYKFLKTVKAV